MKKGLKKYAAITTASVLTLQLAGCADNSGTLNDYMDNVHELTENNEVATDGLVPVQDTEFAKECDEWKFDEDDDSAECIDEDSPLYAQHFFNGVMFATLGAMVGSAMYKSTQSAREERKQASGGGAVVAPSTSTSTTSGNKTNGITSNPSTGTSGDDAAQSKNNANKSGTSATEGSSSGTKSGSQASPSSSGGKSGFSSGGGARGGSSGGS